MSPAAKVSREWGQVMREWGQVGLPAIASATAGLCAIDPLVEPNFDKQLDQKWIEAMVERLIRDRLVSRNDKTVILQNW